MCLSRQIISSGRPHDKVDRAQPIAIDRALSFHVARWSLETGTSVPVAPVWTRATGRELVTIDRARFGKVSCGHGLRPIASWFILIDDRLQNQTDSKH